MKVDGIEIMEYQVELYERFKSALEFIKEHKDFLPTAEDLELAKRFELALDRIKEDSGTWSEDDVERVG